MSPTLLLTEYLQFLVRAGARSPSPGAARVPNAGELAQRRRRARARTARKSWFPTFRTVLLTVSLQILRRARTRTRSPAAVHVDPVGAEAVGNRQVS